LPIIWKYGGLNINAENRSGDDYRPNHMSPRLSIPLQRPPLASRDHRYIYYRTSTRNPWAAHLVGVLHNAGGY
jgi:hypothetical protein